MSHKEIHDLTIVDVNDLLSNLGSRVLVTRESGIQALLKICILQQERIEALEKRVYEK